MIKYIALAGVFVAACGKQEDCKEVENNGKMVCESDLKTTPDQAQRPDQTDNFIIRGSVVSAFPVVVNGKDFGDLESYYSEEVANLPAKVLAAGYDSNWVPSFDAAIGFNDLAIGMSVYIQAQNNRGYQARTLVAKDGTFAVSMPSDAKDDTYMIRANKRINVYLKKDNEVRRFCYNFSANATQISYEEISKPAIINAYSSVLTSYACPAVSETEGLNIPDNSDVPAAVASGTKGAEEPKINEALRGVIGPNSSYYYVRQNADAPGTISHSLATLCDGDEVSSATEADKAAWEATFNLFYYSYTTGLCDRDTLDTAQDCFIATFGSAEPVMGYRTGDLSKQYPITAEKIVYQEGLRVEYLKPAAVWADKVEVCRQITSNILQ